MKIITPAGIVTASLELGNASFRSLKFVERKLEDVSLKTFESHTDWRNVIS